MGGNGLMVVVAVGIVVVVVIEVMVVFVVMNWNNSSIKKQSKPEGKNCLKKITNLLFL